MIEAFFYKLQDSIGDSDPNSNKIYLPAGYTKNDFYAAYIENAENSLHIPDYEQASYSFFLRVSPYFCIPCTRSTNF